jgi:hypothetical protein
MSSDRPDPLPPLTPNDVLPPVEPPSAGFIVQLFVIPAAIVGIIIAVWAAFNWLSHMGSDPRTDIQNLKRNNDQRFTAATNLANELSRDGNEQLRKDPQALADIVEILNKEIAAGSTEERSVSFRAFLCRAVGEFHQAAALPPLIAAVRASSKDDKPEVHLFALQAIARLVPNIPDAKPQDNKELFDVLMTAAKNTDPVIRQHAAYTLAVLGGDQALREVEIMLNDADVDVRMNAAVGLSRYGRVEAIPELAKMLDPDETAGLLSERQEKARGEKRIAMIKNGLNASLKLHEKNSQADMKPIVASIDKLLATNPQTEVRLAGEDAKRKLLAPPEASAGP